MLFFGLAIVSAVAILVLFRYFEKHNIENVLAIGLSYFISALLALAFSFDGNQIQNLISQHSIIAIILGISFFFGFVVLSTSTQKTGVSKTSVAANISVIIPVIVSMLLYDEKLGMKHIIGLLVSLPAIYLFFRPRINNTSFSICFSQSRNSAKRYFLAIYNKQAISNEQKSNNCFREYFKHFSKNNFNKSVLIFPIILFFISGFNNSLMRHAERLGANENPMIFIGLVFAIAFIVSAIFIIIKNRSIRFTNKTLFFGLILGLLNFISTYFFLLALGEFPESIFFPIYNLSFIGASAFVGVLFLNDKFSKLNYLGLALVIFAIVLLNL